jgi:hypothetical protein
MFILIALISRRYRTYWKGSGIIFFYLSAYSIIPDGRKQKLIFTFRI